ncbi:MAG: hypothetical protein KDD45_15865 [Bdellovibrionales bacterium]|nr:hypothetical protein [Bdellovibrionales bacterium]
MELTQEVQNLLSHINQKIHTQNVTSQSKVSLPSNQLSLGELAQLLAILAKEYGTTLPVIIRKLDRVSGDVRALERIYSQKDDKVEWTPEEDDLLQKNPGILARWKGEEAVELRRKYLSTKVK